MEKTATSADQLTAREHEILRRLSNGLSDQQIATELFLSLYTIRWYNRQIYSKLGVGTRTQAVARAQELGLFGYAAASPPSPAPSQILPIGTTSFIGRSRELAGVTRLLQSARLLTLTGVGGTGKTRLALHVASEVRTDFAGGVAFVDLAPVNDPKLLTKTIAAAVGVYESSEPLLNTLKRALADRAMLLLIDNFEHLIEAAPLIAELLLASPGLKFLVTSREPLRLSGEQEYPVPPLSLPSADGSVQSVSDSEAGSLFVQRAQMVLPRFTLSEDNAPAVAEICARLDGLPLAIELAAARCKLLTPQALLARLDSRLNALADGTRDAPARQRTLRAAIEWSYNLLDADEKIRFAEMAIFRGGCALEAIEAVCNDGLTTPLLDVLASLVDKSLVQQKETAGGEPRFVMLETIHEYALEQLNASGEAETVRQRHAAYFVELAERAEPEMRLAQQKRWFGRLDTEQENLRAVLEWSLAGGDITSGVRVSGALSLYWYISGQHVEGLHWTQRLLPHLDDAPEQVHAKFLIGAAHMMWVRNVGTAQPLLMQAIAVSRRLGDTPHEAFALVRLGYTMLGEPDALARVEAGLALFRALDHQPGTAHALTIIGEMARSSGDDDRARRAYEACLAIFRQTGDTRGILITFLNLTFIAQRQGDYEGGRESAREALCLASEMGLRAEIAECLTALAGMIGMTGQPHIAARLFGAADSELKRLGAFFDASDRPEFDRMIESVRAQLSEATFQTAWVEGKQLALEAAVACALE